MNLRGLGWRLAGTNIPPQIVWPKGGGGTANSAMDQIFELFPDKYPTFLSENGETWTFALGWPRHLLESIDPVLQERAQTCYGLELAQLADYLEVRKYGRIDFVFSLFHSRALLAPVLANVRRGAQPLRWVVHVDAHHDLAAPLLTVASPALLTSDCFKIECCLDDPESITRSIDCGLIHKGSFLTAFCLGSPSGHLFHVFKGISPAQFWLHRATGSVQIGRVMTLHDSLKFECAPLLGAWKILETSNLPLNLPMEARDGVWLDVDLDAFCNRFDGDSDRRDRPTCAEEVDAMQLGIATFLENLSNAVWLPHIEAVSVAASPGFFPSELWELAIPKVCEGIAKAISL